MKSPIDNMMDSIPMVELGVPDETKNSGSVYATHEGLLVIGELNFRCYQLSDGRRLLDAEDVKKHFSGSGIKAVDELLESEVIPFVKN